MNPTYVLGLLLRTVVVVLSVMVTVPALGPARAGIVVVGISVVLAMAWTVVVNVTVGAVVAPPFLLDPPDPPVPPGCPCPPLGGMHQPPSVQL
jgi:hypothetical protein